MPIDKYYQKIKQIKLHSQNEGALSRHFLDLVDSFLPAGFVLIDENPIKSNYPDANNRQKLIYPDSTLFAPTGLPWGIIENKDPKDDFEKEISSKKKDGYPLDNIIFENTQKLILYQSQIRVAEIDISNKEDLKDTILKFINFKPVAVSDYETELENFKQNVPKITKLLHNLITQEYNDNNKFKNALNQLLQETQASINNSLNLSNIEEMLVQHLFTREIFSIIFREISFHQTNSIAKKLNEIILLINPTLLKPVLNEIDNYHKTILNISRFIGTFSAKQKLLKNIYEEFYKAYNPKKADRYGIVYTPNEIVDFMIKFSDNLLKKHFQKQMVDDNINILDPCTGTGVYATSILNYLSGTYHKDYLFKVYENNLFINEIDLLPYYIASLNIENTYLELLGKSLQGLFKPFENICLVDTLEVLGSNQKGGDLFESLSSDENNQRIQKQKEKKISLIIGNPPYNANQLSENDNNKNKVYKSVDARIKETYVQESTAQKTKQYDMYKRFIRWACDRIEEKQGIVAFITNNSFIDSKQDDGFRKVVEKEFDYIYIYDLKGNARLKEDKSQGKSVFNIQVGTAISFFVKTGEKEEEAKGKIYYIKTKDGASKEDKLLEILHNTNNYHNLTWQEIIPDKKYNWINKSTSDFEELTPLIDKKLKQLALKSPTEAQVLEANNIFKIFSLGVVTNRDDWVYAFDKDNLAKKVKKFIEIYNNDIENFKKIGLKQNQKIEDFIDYSIKWSETLKKHFKSKIYFKFNKEKITPTLYRPFAKQYVYFDNHFLDRQGQNPAIFPTKEAKNICINVNHTDRLSFSPFIADKMINLTPLVKSASNSIPLYYYINGKRYDNITNWALKTFQEHYNNFQITKEDIFYYVYAALNNPNYKEKYKLDLQKEYPRIPFYKDFFKFSNWGKELANLHINYENQPKNTEIKIVNENEDSKKPTLKITKEGNIELDKSILITNIPKEAFEYNLGGKPALKWLLDGYKPKKLNPEEKHHQTLISNGLDYYSWQEHKATLLDLIPKLITVSIETNKIHQQIQKEKE